MTRTYPCIFLHQRQGTDAPRFCLFAAPVAQVLEWATVERLGPGSTAPQRRESPAKVEAVRRFLESESQNTIPTTIITTIEEGAVTLDDPGGDFSGAGTITIDFDDENTPGLIIDGQHRLAGMNEYRPDMPVGIVALLGADDAEKAFQFLVVNNKASKVPTDHLRALALTYDEARLQQRLKSARLSLNKNLSFVGFVNDEQQSPFYHLIDWPLNEQENRVVPPAAIESAFSYIQNQKLRELRTMGEDVMLEFFYAIWRPIREAWPDQWETDRPRRSKLLGKVGVVCMTQYLTSSIIRQKDSMPSNLVALREALTARGQLDMLDALPPEIDVTDPADVERIVRSELAYLTEDFFEVEWTAKGLDTHAGRALLIDALVQISRNNKADGVPWFADVDIVDPSRFTDSAEDAGA